MRESTTVRGDARVALLMPYWSLFEAAVPFDLRAERLALLDEVAGWLDGHVAVQELVDSAAAGADTAERVRAARADALVVAVSMAAPPAFALAALDPLPELPLAVLAVSRRTRFDDGLDHAGITAEGATVGAPQLTNVLHRRGRRHALATASPDQPEPAARAARAAAAAGRLRRARIARVGSPIEGYDCVVCDPDALRAATGIELVDVAPASVRDAYLAAEAARPTSDRPAAAAGAATERAGRPTGDHPTNDRPAATGDRPVTAEPAAPASPAAIEAEVRRTFSVATEVEGECLSRSVRFAAALQALDDALGVDAGAMNCHVPEIRLARGEPGIAPCFALGRETSRGIPWSCSGDVVTAVALLTVKLLGGAALYHEIEALDRGTGEALLANSGEHDLAFADPSERPALARSPWWPGSACACFGPPPGPATLVAFTPHAAEPGGFRYVVAEGTFTPRRLRATGTPHAAFRFATDDDIATAWTRWARAGANHHSAATPGHLGAAVADVAEHLGLGCVRVS